MCDYYYHTTEKEEIITSSSQKFTKLRAGYAIITADNIFALKERFVDMSNFRYRLLQFMQGRRGPDQFTEFLFAASGICIAFNILWRNDITGTLGIALCIYGIYRALSRNIHKREQENNWFLAMKYKFTGGRASGNRFRSPKGSGGYGGSGSSSGYGGYTGTGRGSFGGYRGEAPRYDMQNYVYFRCPSCSQKLRAPRGKGRIKIRCSRCGEQFNKKV